METKAVAVAAVIAEEAVEETAAVAVAAIVAVGAAAVKAAAGRTDEASHE
jgi:hypothetical protein